MSKKVNCCYGLTTTESHYCHKIQNYTNEDNGIQHISKNKDKGDLCEIGKSKNGKMVYFFIEIHTTEYIIKRTRTKFSIILYNILESTVSNFIADMNSLQQLVTHDYNILTHLFKRMFVNSFLAAVLVNILNPHCE